MVWWQQDTASCGRNFRHGTADGKGQKGRFLMSRDNFQALRTGFMTWGRRFLMSRSHFQISRSHFVTSGNDCQKSRQHFLNTRTLLRNQPITSWSHGAASRTWKLASHCRETGSWYFRTSSLSRERVSRNQEISSLYSEITGSYLEMSWSKWMFGHACCIVGHAPIHSRGKNTHGVYQWK